MVTEQSRGHSPLQCIQPNPSAFLLPTPQPLSLPFITADVYPMPCQALLLLPVPLINFDLGLLTKNTSLALSFKPYSRHLTFVVTIGQRQNNTNAMSQPCCHPPH
jgi:hypothetical protein